MSYLTKFGISDEPTLFTTISSPGIGFKLTPHGHYDIQRKKLKNVSNAEDDNDAVTKKQCLTLNSDGNYDANNNGIGNLGNPNLDGDAINLRYFNTFGLNSQNNMYNAKQRQIINVAETENGVVTTSYLKKHALLTDENEFDANNKRVKNVCDPENLTDVATKRYVDNLTKLQIDPSNSLIRNEGGLFVPQSIKLLVEKYDAENREIINVAQPETDSSAVNKSYLERMCLTGLENFNAGYKKIGNLGHPKADRNATTKKYVVDLTEIDPNPNNSLVRTENGLFVGKSVSSPTIALLFGDSEVTQDRANAKYEIAEGTVLPIRTPPIFLDNYHYCPSDGRIVCLYCCTTNPAFSMKYNLNLDDIKVSEITRHRNSQFAEKCENMTFRKGTKISISIGKDYPEQRERRIYSATTTSALNHWFYVFIQYV